LLLSSLQVTRKVSALFIQALQQADSQPAVLPQLAGSLMVLWLSKAQPAGIASPESRAATTVRQQLQDSQLLQHLATNLDAAAARLTAAAAAFAEAAANSTTTAGADAMQHATIVVQCSSDFTNAESVCKSLLQIFRLASCVLSQTGKFTIPVALPAAPTAVRTALTIFRVYRSPLPASPGPLRAALRTIRVLAVPFLGKKDVPGSMLQSCPAASVLVQMPEFVSCLAIMAVATTLGLDVSGGDTASGAASSSSDMGSSTGTGRQQQEQQAASAATGRRGGTSSSSSGGGGGGSTSSSSSSQSNGMQLDSLTPLSCSLFDILGVTKETVLQLAGLAKAEGCTSPGALRNVVEAYTGVLQHQVSVCGHIRCRTLCFV
jgi:hypothetical protein